MIAVGDKRAIAVRGDYRPVEINVGGRKVAGWTEQAVEGVTQAEIADTYNDRAQVTVQGERLEQVSTTGKNLMPPLVKGIWLSPNTGAASANAEGAASEYVPWSVTAPAYISGIVNTLYSFVAAYDADRQYIARSSGGKRSTLALKDGAFGADVDHSTIAYIRLTIYQNGSATSGVIDDIDAAQIQMELGDTATDYEPYSGGYASPSPEWPQPIHGMEAVVTVSNADTEAVETTLPVLYGRDGVCDVLETDVVVDGVHRSRVTRWWQTVVQDGSENWRRNVVYTNGNLYRIQIKGYKQADGRCSHYPTAATYTQERVVYFGQSININTPDHATVDDFTAYLAAQYAAGTPVTIVYQLAEPIVELGDPIDVRTLPRSTIIGCTDPFSAVVKVVERDA